MIDYKPTLVSELKTIGLPVKYELFLTTDTEKPCITYKEANNSSHKEGDTLWYSELTYDIKVWAKSVMEIALYSQKLDTLMRGLGFTRTSYAET